MDATNDSGYKPRPEFRENKKDSLIDIDLTDSTELWLIQWPINKDKDRDLTAEYIDGQEVQLKLHHDGRLGSIEGSSGKSYELFSYKCQDADKFVFLSSASGSKIAGKISRRVSLIHYPDPSELQQHNSITLAQMSSIATSIRSGRQFATPTRSIKPGRTLSTPSSGNKSSLSGHVESSKPSKRKNNDEPRRSTNHSAQDSGRGNSAVTSTGSVHSSERKSKKEKKT